MPDLSTEGIQRWIADYRRTPTEADKRQGIRDIERLHPVEQALTSLGHALDRARESDLSAFRTALVEPSVRDALRRIMAQLGPNRMLRLLDWLSSDETPEATEVLKNLFNSFSDINVLAMRERLQQLHRSELLNRLFDADRVGSLLSACRIVQKEPA